MPTIEGRPFCPTRPAKPRGIREMLPRAQSGAMIRAMKNSFALYCLGILSAISLSACGGDSESSCSNAAPCGGSIVGTWRVTSSCLSVSSSAFAEGCPGATASSSNLRITGSGTYNADLTYVSSAALSGSMSMTLPAACLMAAGFIITCPELQALFATDPTFSSPTCTMAGSACKCVLPLSGQTTTESGTYTTTAAGVLTATPQGETAEENDYCVKGTTLTISPHQGTMMMGEAGISGSITFAKQ